MGDSGDTRTSHETSRRYSSPEQVRELIGENVQLRENLRIMETVRDRLSRLTERQMMVNQISQELTTLDLDKVAEIAAGKLSLLVAARYCSLFLHEEADGELVLKSHNHPTDITRRVAIRLHRNTVMGLAFRKKEIVHIVDIDEYERVQGSTFERTFADKYATKTCVSVPLAIDGTVIGILNFADKTDGSFFDEIDDLPIIVQVRSLLTMAIRNCQLFDIVQRQAMTDSLTGIANPRAFQEALQREVHRAGRYGRPLSLLMTDIDRFKGINDSLGHPAGDFALKEICRAIASIVRREDVAARYGGDEIAILLPETSVTGAVTLGGRIVNAIRSLAVTFEGKQMPLTISMGIASFASGMSPAELIRSADNALYDAKRQGRDRFAIASLR